MANLNRMIRKGFSDLAKFESVTGGSERLRYKERQVQRSSDSNTSIYTFEEVQREYHDY